MHLSDRFSSQPWHVHPQAIPALLQRLEQGVKLEQNSGPQKLTIADFVQQRQPMVITPDGAAIIHVCGTLGRSLVNVEKICGDTDYNDIMADVAAASEDQRVVAIVLAINSGGGSVIGEPECRDAILAAAQVKPVVAYTEGMMCSAAYAIAAGATKILASPSAIVGSIGTITMLADYTGYFEQWGVKFHVVPGTKSDLKSTYWPQVAPTGEQLAEVQRFVDRFNDDFTGFVKAHRLEVTDSTMRGQAFDAREALDLGLIDGTCDFDTAIDEALALA